MFYTSRETLKKVERSTSKPNGGPDTQRSLAEEMNKDALGVRTAHKLGYEAPPRLTRHHHV